MNEKGKKLKKEAKDKALTPERYGMIVCRYCNGLGKFVNESNAIEVCKACGGFGAVRSMTEGAIDENQNP